MATSLRIMEATVIAGGVLLCVCGMDRAASVEVQSPAVQTPKINPPKVNSPKINTTNTVKTNTLTKDAGKGQIGSAVQGKTANGSTSSANGNPSSGSAASSGQKPPTGGDGVTIDGKTYPQGVHYNAGGAGDKPTVTIDGKTMPVNEATPALIKEAETPPPKMWLGNQLVQITKQNIQKENELQSEEVEQKSPQHDEGTSGNEATIKLDQKGGDH